MAEYVIKKSAIRTGKLLRRMDGAPVRRCHYELCARRVERVPVALPLAGMTIPSDAVPTPDLSQITQTVNDTVQEVMALRLGG